ncbi:MAG: hypothetical protein QOK21_3308 [Solirubrobacteraceae bacterium]|jgi:hypothetical protein|nr:hypothetical protein [Solirubrobacteraceae bacterium]
MDVNPIELQKYLKGADYPADKGELAQLAESNGAPSEIVDAIRSASQESFDGPSGVQKSLA